VSSGEPQTEAKRGGEAARGGAPCQTVNLLPRPASTFPPPASTTHVPPNARLSEERLDELKLEYIAHRSERGRDAVELLTAERRAKLLRMAGKKDEAAEMDKKIEGLRLAKHEGVAKQQ
jgi:hypothetical protein